MWLQPGQTSSDVAFSHTTLAQAVLQLVSCAVGPEYPSSLFEEPHGKMMFICLLAASLLCAAHNPYGMYQPGPYAGPTGAYPGSYAGPYAGPTGAYPGMMDPYGGGNPFMMGPGPYAGPTGAHSMAIVPVGGCRAIVCTSSGVRKKQDATCKWSGKCRRSFFVLCLVVGQFAVAEDSSQVSRLFC